MDKHFEKLQNLSEDKKIMIMWIGAPLTTALIIYSWFVFAGFGINKIIVQKPAENEKISKLEVFKNGFKITVKEIQSFIKTAKEKISKTELLNPKTTESSESLESKINNNLKTAEIKDAFKITSVKAGNPVENSGFKITSVEAGSQSENTSFKIESVEISSTK